MIKDVVYKSSAQLKKNKKCNADKYNRHMWSGQFIPFDDHADDYQQLVFT